MARREAWMEAVIGIAAIAVLANLSLPLIQNIGVARVASRAVHDLERVRDAAQRYHGETRDWPRSAPAGETPRELSSQLPPGFSFRSEQFQLAWERWDVGVAPAREGQDDVVVAVSVIARDERVADRVARVLGDRGTHFTLGNRTTLVVAEPRRTGR